MAPAWSLECDVPTIAGNVQGDRRKAKMDACCGALSGSQQEEYRQMPHQVLSLKHL